MSRTATSNTTLKRTLSSTALNTATSFKAGILTQIDLTSTGKAPEAFEIERSAWVGLSCLLFLVIAYKFYTAALYVQAGLFLVQTFLSFQADCWSPKSKFYNRADRISATSLIVLGPVRVILQPGIASFEFRLQAFACLFGSILVLAWSRQSRSQAQYVLRHSCWHVAGFVSLYLYADRVLNGRTFEQHWPNRSEWWAFGVNA